MKKQRIINIELDKNKLKNYFSNQIDAKEALKNIFEKNGCKYENSVGFITQEKYGNMKIISNLKKIFASNIWLLNTKADIKVSSIDNANKKIVNELNGKKLSESFLIKNIKALNNLKFFNFKNEFCQLYNGADLFNDIEKSHLRFINLAASISNNEKEMTMEIISHSKLLKGIPKVNVEKKVNFVLSAVRLNKSKDKKTQSKRAENIKM